MKAIIFCNGEVSDYNWLKGLDMSDKLVICADGGIGHAERIGVCPHILIGDNDSVKDFKACAKETFVYPPEKDFTDGQLCVDCAIERGCKEIELVAALGGRHDHEYSHYCLMSYAMDKGASLSIIDEKNYIYMTDCPIELQNIGYKYVSFFPYGGEVEGFSLRGFKYNTEPITLSCSRVQASSNELSDDKIGYVNFTSGRLLVILSKD